jgi:hypothetical protein
LVTFSTGIISTLAGTGVKGFSGDGAAGSAALARPQGIALDASGNAYVADSDNNLIRTISGGQVTTIAGNGEEGSTGNSGASTSASLDSPRAVATQGSSVVFSDTQNNSVQAVNGGALNTIGGQPNQQNESLVLNGPISVVYGTGALTATFSNGSNTGTGMVTFYDGLGSNPAISGAATLSGNAATLNTSQLSAGLHYIVASYAGDANNAAIVSGVYVLTVTPVQLSAVANTVNLLYGQSIPALTGTLSGVLAQDTGKVTAAYSTSATIVSDPGTFPISVALGGTAAGNYTVVLGAGSGSVVIAQAPSKTTLTASSGTSIFGTSVTLTATVASTTSGNPGGTVNFYDGASLLNATPGAIGGGTATLTLSALSVGAHSLSVVYSGSKDFLTSTSTTLPENVLSPDFAIAATPSDQSVLPSNSMPFTITLTPVNPTFVYPLSLSATGLPSGVTANFSPSSIATGAGTSTSTLTLTASSSVGLHNNDRPFGRLAGSTALAFLSLPLLFTRRARERGRCLSRASKMLIAVLALAALSTLAGCGGGGFFSHTTNTSTVTVTAVCGPDTRSTTVTLTVQ